MRYHVRLPLKRQLTSAIWGLLALFYCLDSFGATYYVDCTNGNNSNDGLSTGAPKLTVGNITIGASDVIRIKGGTVCNEQITLTSVDGVTIENWPSDSDSVNDTSGRWIIDGQNTRSYGILADRTTNTTISDGILRNATQNGHAWVNDSAGVTDSNMTLNRVIAHDIGPGIYPMSGESEFDNGTCFFARTGFNTGTAVLDGLTYNDTVAYNCGKHGYDTRWRLLNVTYNRAVAYEAGLTSTGHGFSIHPLFETFTATGWTDADGGGAGTVYYRDRSSNSNQERRFINSTNNVILDQNTGTPTAPSTNQWGVVSAGGGGACTGNATVGCLYVNIGGALTGKTFIVKRFPHGPFIYNQCVSYNNRDSQSLVEGHGFSADDLSGPAVYNSSYAYGNEGDGFKTLRGESIVWRGNLSYLNGDSGFALTSCTNCELTNNTADSNVTRGFWDGGIVSVNVDITNNIATNDVARGFSMSAGTVAASGYSDASNITFNNANNGCTGVVNCTASDPGYVGGLTPTTKEGFRLGTGAARRAGTDLNIGNYQDNGNRAFAHPPSIGAWEAASGDIATARTAATSRTAATARTAASARTSR